MKILFGFSLLACKVVAFTNPSAPRLPTQLNLYESVNEAIAEAQRICANDPSSPECKVAWDIVEELEAADSHNQALAQQTQPDGQSMDYVAMMGSFDILTQKIDGKMDQLKATTEKLQSLGASDPSVAELARLSDEMKATLARARASFNQ